MKIAKLPLALAAATFAVAPVAAQAIEAERDAAPVNAESELGGSSTVFIIIAAVAAIGLGILILDGDDDDAPVSP